MASCGKCLHKEVCVDYRYYKPIAEKCQHFKEFNVDKKLQTNADRIRSMSDEELAKFIVDEMCLYCQTYKTEECYNKCISEQIEWLKQPAE